MKKLLLLSMLFVASVSFGQLEVKKPTESTTLFSSVTKLRLVKFEKDTLVFYALYYQNAKYTHITDTKYLSFSDSLEVKQFLELAIKSIDEKEEFETSKYSIKKYMGKSVFVMNEDGSYFILNKKYAIKMQLALK